MLSLLAFSAEADSASDVDTPRYVYAWQYAEEDAMRPRGGTTVGPDVELAVEAGAGWQALAEGGLTKFQRDRRAILALAGEYRTTFDFIETMGFDTDYEPAQPYQSWATEMIEVIANEPRFISLQHILVMHFKQPDGSISEPVVVKHQRQDWRYEAPTFHTYAGTNTWRQSGLDKSAVSGAWTQSVFQVDDSPRYASAGRWQHHARYSTWDGDNTWRPLPRREFSVRDDYQVLAGSNRITLTALGWVHEQDNLKLVLQDAGETEISDPAIARETGLVRYESITDYDFSAGQQYWQRTREFWALVRSAWQIILSESAVVRLRAGEGQEPMYAELFDAAEQFGKDTDRTLEATKNEINRILGKHVVEEPMTSSAD